MNPSRPVELPDPALADDPTFEALDTLIANEMLDRVGVAEDPEAAGDVDTAVPASSDDGWPWRVPGAWWLHVVALTVVLFGLIGAVDHGAMISADEGALYSQAEIISQTGQWSMSNPLPEVDPDGRWFGIDISEQVGERFYPYAKHGAYPAIVAPLYSWGGTRAILWLSAVGTVAAAAAAAVIARRLSPRLDTPTLWVVGLISPLFFDSFWAIAHSLGAACATVAVLGALRVLEDRRPRSLLLVALGTAAAVFLRSEGLLFGLALGGAAGAIAFWPLIADRLPTSGRRRGWGMALAATAGGSAVVAWVADSRLHSLIVGTGVAPFTIVSDEGSSWWSDRAAGLWASVLRPQLLAPTPAGAVFLAILPLSLIVCVYLRRRPQERTLIRGGAMLGALAAVATLALKPAPVPGLLVAFPLLVVGLCLLTRSTLRTGPAQLIVGTSTLFGLAVIATQYPVGGSMEWGGRFFHLVLPSLTPVLLWSVAQARHRVDARTARIAVGSLATVSVVLTVTAIGTVHRLHSVTDEIVVTLVDLAEDTRSAEDPGGPVVVSNMEAVGRISWRSALTGRYLKVTDGDDLAEVAERLAAAGVEDFVFAAVAEPQRDRDRLVGYRADEARTVTLGAWTFFVMERSPETGAP